MRLFKPKAWMLGTALALGLVNQAAHSEVMVHLFQWKYNDVATECENYLAPKGYGSVQISPPSEHIQGSQWWTVYQPVNYKNFTSRSGTQAELQSMISRCNAVGVKVYADAVFNQLASSTGTGTGGSSFNGSAFTFPYFGYNDFHHAGSVTDYTNRSNVQNGSLLGMPDLDTGASYVQGQIATYLKTLTSWGVAGFRIDAAKHIAASDIASILSQAGNPFVYQEVIGASGEAVQPSEYLGNGVVTEFNYGTDLASNFKGQIKNLKTLGESWGLMSSDKVEVFVVNHDRERGQGGSGMLTYKDGTLYNLANVYMLASPYGKYKQVMSGYDFGTDTDMGGPSVTPCTSPWNCDHRWSNIANMVAFANTVDGTTQTNWWDDGNNAIAFGRGGKGFVVINNESSSLTQTLQTGMPAGTYCNVLAGTSACSGSNITVDASGYASFTVGAMQAAAIHINAVPCTSNCPVTAKFTSMYFRGTPNSWGSTAMTVDTKTRVWSATVTFTGAADSTGSQRFKFDVKGDWTQNYGDTNKDGIADLAGADIATSVVGQYLVQLKESDMSYTLTKVSTNQPPVAAISPKATTVTVGQSVTFDASASTDDNAVTGYSWSNGGTGATQTITFDTAGTQTVTVTVSDAQGLTSTATSTVTVTAASNQYASNYASMYFRGTPNSWAAAAMTLVADHVWQANVNFTGASDSNGTQRFKFDVKGDWTQNFGDTNKDGVAELSGADIYTSVVGTYQVQFNDATLKYTLTKVGGYTSAYSSMYFRGTPNSWGSTAMTLVADNTWQAEVSFTGAGDSSGSQRFKFDVKGDWTTNFGDNNNDGVADASGADIKTAVVGKYLVKFNDSTKAYSLTAE